MYAFEQVEVTPQAHREHAAFLKAVFGTGDLFTEAYVDWQYAQNPEGAIVGFNARAGSSLAAHYVTMPMSAVRDGRTVKGLLSLNTATHREHQGKGLFTQLAEKTFAHAAAQGFEFVVGVANQNSVHGFIKKLGFQQVGQLHALLGVGRIDLPTDASVGYRRAWTKNSLAWRLSHPGKKYQKKATATGVQVWSSSGYPGIGALLGTFAEGLIEGDASSHRTLSTLWIGTHPHVVRKGVFVDIPVKYRPAPLNLIYRDLTGKADKLRFDEVHFDCLDFDAY